MLGPFSKYFRTGAEKKTSTKAILDDVNSAFGSAYKPEPGSIIYLENLSLAREIARWFDGVERFKNQALPSKMTIAIPRWESILGILPRSGASDAERRRAIGAKLRMFNVAPTDQATRDYLNQLIPELFIELRRTDPESALGSLPGGVEITGGVSLPDGSWQSDVSTIMIRVFQPLNMSDQEYYSKVDSYVAALGDFLPAHVMFQHGRFTYEPPGTITVVAGSSSLTGIGTSFTNDPSDIVLAPGDELESFDDNGRLSRHVIETINSDDSITLAVPASSNVTSKKFRIAGFVLGFPNIDNAFLT